MLTMDCESQPLKGINPPDKSGYTAHQPIRDTPQRTSFKLIMDSFLLGALCLVLGRSLVHAILHDTSIHPRTVTYPGESIAWTPCGTINNRALECANLTVPMDHFNATNNLPDNKHFTIAMVRLRSPDPNATKTMLLNPGGPGGSGTSMIYTKGAQLHTILGDGPGTPHLLGFDPRGINMSIPRASCIPPEVFENTDLRRDIGAVASSIRAKKTLEDSGELWAWTRAWAQACAEAPGPHAAYINTPQTAADMVAILDALGQKRLYYWGFSYGTVLGQTFATMYPERVERVIIDGVANQVDWYTQQLDAEMMTDTERVLEGFAEECVKAGKERCKLAEMAGSGEELVEVILREIEKLKEDPVGVYINSTVYGVLDGWKVMNDAVFPALYKPATWGDLAELLAALFNGNATPAFLEFGRKGAWDSIMEGFKFVTFNDGVSGPERWNVSNRHELVDILLPFFNESIFGDTHLDVYFSKQAWALPKTHTYEPRSKVRTAHPLLVLTTTYDPVCPLVSAQKASAVFEGSRIVEIKGYGHCSLAVPSTCLARHVREYVLHGKLPKGDVKCDRDGNLYFAKPDNATSMLKAVAVDDEDQRLRLAQLELARDMWPSAWRHS
ncbi:hypothetical protein VTJ49DRAFT_5143 [Mycothermus thermophilus]|uniref:Uncharacterized protein n=1 Tax=Humicola insolens TaxID=85995 RepID=A0ABR3V3T5_HUMIN